MVYARYRTTRKGERRPLAITRLALGLIVVGALAIAALALPLLTEASPNRALNTSRERLERGFRLRERSPAASAFKVPMTAVAPAMFASITVDRTDDTAAASACTAAANDCSLRGAVSFANANPGTTIIIPAGTYQLNIPGGAGEGFSGNNAIGDLDITGNNTTISGAGASTTIIQQTQPNDRVIEVNPFLDANFTTSISGVTISGGHETTGVGGGGIISGSQNNSLTISNCVFSGNSATGAGTLGGGAISHAGGSLTITGTTFNNNSTSASGGGVGYSAGDPLGRTPSTGTLSVSGSTFSSNTSTSAAGGGGALDLFNFNLSVSTYHVDTSTFNSNHATNGSGGAIIVESGSLTATTSAITNNNAGLSGGGVFSAGSASITFSRLVNNSVPIPTSGLTVFSATTAITANDNWWGVNTGPSANDFRSLGGPITPASYLRLRISANPTELCSGHSSLLTADIKQRNTGVALTTELNGLPTFTAVFNNAVLGTLSGATNFVNGVATATYTAGGTSGTGSADVTADNQSLTVNITVSANNTTNPGNQTVCEGQTATFSTTASGPGTITFVWKKGVTVLNNGDLGGRVTITNGANTSSLSISNAQASDSGTYTVEATGECNTTSESATLTVNPNTTATDPADQTVCQGTNANFSTTATGSNLHYAWTLDGSPFGGDTSSISVATGALTVGGHTVGLTVTGDCGTVTQSASLTVQANTTATDPADQTVCQGTDAHFSTTATGTNVHYAWTLDGSPFNGDSASITVPTGSLSVGSHTVGLTVTGSCGTVTQSATLTVKANTTATDPADQTVCQGTNANFSTTATGSNLHYAWTLDGSPFGGDTSSISVATGALTVGGHTVGLTVTGDCGTVTQSASLTVQANTTATDPVDQTVCQGTDAHFSTTATGTNVHYAWTLDGSPFNGDSASITVPTGSLSVGSHTVGLTVTGSCGTVTQSATLTVQANTATTDPADQSVCQGTDAHFSTTASGTGPFHYAWTLDGSPFNGDNPSITVPTGSLSVGNHTVTVTTTGTCGTATQTATLTVTSATPVINLSSTSATMWPPNHQYQTFNVSDFVSSATAGCDNHDVTSSVVIQKVSSDEPEDNPSGGDGNTLNDIVIAPDCKSVQLRSERDGNLDGRVYTITFKVTDSFGNTATATVKISVPKSSNSPAVDSGAAAGYTVNGSCP